MPPTWVRWAAALVGGAAALWSTWHDSNLGTVDHRWVLVVTLLVAVAVGEALSGLVHLLPTPGAIPAALACTLVAVYACVPETDQVAPVAGAILAILAVELIGGRLLSWWWHAGLAWLVLWSGLYGATGRSSALVGALFAWWTVMALPLLHPLARRLRSRPPTLAPLLSRFAAVVMSATAAVVVARSGALAATIDPAVRAVAVWWPVSALAVVLVLVPSTGASTSSAEN